MKKKKKNSNKKKTNAWSLIELNSPNPEAIYDHLYTIITSANPRSALY